MELAIYTQEGKDTGRKAVLNDEVFAIEPNEHVLYLAVKQYLANPRPGTAKAADGRIIVVEDIKIDAPKTKEFVKIAKALNFEGKKVLVLNADIDRNVTLSARNVPGVNILRAGDANTYALLNNNVIIITESSLETVNKF